MKFPVLAASIIALAVSAPANAATLLFDFVGVNPEFDASWELDSNPVPDLTTSGLFQISGVVVTTPARVDLKSINFISASIGGGFNFNESSGFDAAGPQLFTGTLSNPVFAPGVFALNEFGSTRPIGTLTISALDAAVPEPATWAMMVGGMFLAGGALRRRKVALKVTWTSPKLRTA